MLWRRPGRRAVYLKISTDPSGFVSKRPEVQGFPRMRPALVLEAPSYGCGSRRSPTNRYELWSCNLSLRRHPTGCGSYSECLNVTRQPWSSGYGAVQRMKRLEL